MHFADISLLVVSVLVLVYLMYALVFPEKF